MRIGLMLKNYEAMIGAKLKIDVQEGAINESELSGPRDNSAKKGSICLHKHKS
jgi:hypothetical protein